MICLNCNKIFLIKRNILNLFSLKKEYICECCYKKVVFCPNDIILPIENFKLKVYYLIKSDEKFKYDCFVNENSKIYSKLKEKDYFIITFNRFYLCDKNYIILEQLANHLKMNILVLVYELFD